jgi:hypothetical protein
MAYVVREQKAYTGYTAVGCGGIKYRLKDVLA